MGGPRCGPPGVAFQLNRERPGPVSGLGAVMSGSRTPPHVRNGGWRTQIAQFGYASHHSKGVGPARALRLTDFARMF